MAAVNTFLRTTFCDFPHFLGRLFAIFHTFKDDFYWSAENSRGEIDFLVQDEERIIPIEVKAEENLQAKSLRVFVERNQGLKGMRLSMSPYREQDWLANYPLYSVSAIFD